MKPDRKHPSLMIKLASALLTMRHEVDGKLVPIFTFEEAKALSAEQICSLFQFDHYPIRHDDGGPLEPWNLVPRLIKAHRIKTATIDVPQMRKADRINKTQEEFRQRMLVPKDQRPPKQSRWGSRPFPKKEKTNDATRSRRRP